MTNKQEQNSWSTFIFVGVALVTLISLGVNGACPPSLSKDAIWAGTTSRETAWEVIGLGGRYGLLSTKFLSKQNFIESDHFPPKSAYRHAKDARIKNLSERDMAAVTVRYEFHRGFYTTGNNPNSLTLMENHFKNGDYFKAIDTNIKWYQTNPDRIAGNERQGAMNLIREGIVGALNVHVRNGLITEAQKTDLIRKHSLNNYKNNISFIINSARRTAAREHLSC